METDWNVIATANAREHRNPVRLLKHFGDFRWTPYLGVLVGRVEDHQALFEQLSRWEEDEPGVLAPLARIIPLDHTFEFTVGSLPARLKDVVWSYADRIDSGSFYVRLERRGHAGEVHAQAIEQELDELLTKMLLERGMKPSVDFKDPDIIIAAETVGDTCGVGMITRDVRARFPFVRVP